MLNALTVDVEDWPQSSLDRSWPISERALHNTRRMLALLVEEGVQATFFVQGMVAERFPELVKEIAAPGHEVATHGHSHELIFRLGRRAFAAELRYSVQMLEDLSGQRVLGHRAPDFSITKDSLWALEEIAALGLRYDSSIFPIYNPRYGIQDAQRFPHFRNGLIEFPISTVRWAGINLPVAGGGYLRLFPYAVTRWAIRRINAQGQPAMIYLHPYELDTEELRLLGDQIPWSLRLTQGLNRGRTEAKLRALMRDFELAAVREVLGL
jgi:polysaccharide deacetylase family protein (PEP-CTERM system associated)